jgi:hypothetical protein
MPVESVKPHNSFERFWIEWQRRNRTPEPIIAHNVRADRVRDNLNSVGLLPNHHSLTDAASARTATINHDVRKPWITGKMNRQEVDLLFGHHHIDSFELLIHCYPGLFLAGLLVLAHHEEKTLLPLYASYTDTTHFGQLEAHVAIPDKLTASYELRESRTTLPSDSEVIARYLSESGYLRKMPGFPVLSWSMLTEAAEITRTTVLSE